MLNSFLQELKHTFRVLLRLYEDAVWRYRWSSLLIVILDVMAIVLAGMVIGGVLKTAQAISQSETIALPFGLTPLDPNVPSNLVWLGVGFFFVGFAGAVAFWYTRKTSRNTAARYQHFCSMRALRLLQSEKPAYWMMTAENQTPSNLLRFCAELGPQLMNRCFVWVMQSIRSTILMVVTGLGLFYFNALLSLVLVPLSIVYLLILTKLS
ncbi:MAG: hypothetical protein O7G85_15735, partial [Planctomycetota bacterium]|nr:hypothetical protein [Planctomycetota bacterium]